MFDKNKFKYFVSRKGLTMEQVAENLNMNATTLYRKMSGTSDFSRAEVQELKTLLGLSVDESEEVFFARELA